MTIENRMQAAGQLAQAGLPSLGSLVGSIAVGADTGDTIGGVTDIQISDPYQGIGFKRAAANVWLITGSGGGTIQISGSSDLFVPGDAILQAAFLRILDGRPYLPANPTDYPDAGRLFKMGDPTTDGGTYTVVRIPPKA